jgi:hypothetical protein
MSEVGNILFGFVVGTGIVIYHHSGDDKKFALKHAFTFAEVKDTAEQGIIQNVIEKHSGNCGVLSGNIQVACDRVKANAIKLGYNIK